MRKDTLELLTIIPTSEIKDIGILFMKHLLAREHIDAETNEKWIHFGTILRRLG
jgi:hypothetical protein